MENILIRKSDKIIEIIGSFEGDVPKERFEKFSRICRFESYKENEKDKIFYEEEKDLVFKYKFDIFKVLIHPTTKEIERICELNSSDWFSITKAIHLKNEEALTKEISMMDYYKYIND